MEWVNEKREDADEKGVLNPFDATMIAQITPGELGNAFHALEYAKDLVVEWLINFKFKNWKVTETNNTPVTKKMKQEQAERIAKDLTDRSKWRTHGRSIKAADLESIGLKIKRIEANEKLSDVVNRIQTVCRLLFHSTSAFKIFATQDGKIFRHAAQTGAPQQVPKNQVPSVVVEIDQKCPKCGAVHKIYAKLVKDQKIDKDFKVKGRKPFPENGKLACGCGFEIDLSGVRNNIEMQTGRQIIL